MTDAEVFDAYNDEFGESPPFTPWGGTKEELVALWLKALDRGSPTTMEELIGNDPELLAILSHGVQRCRPRS